MGNQGITGPTGVTGAAGASALAITQQSICGTGGTSLCKIGAQGPGGGIIFFADYYDQYSGFDYLEIAPLACEAVKPWASDTTNSLTAVTGWAAQAVGKGQANTTAMLANSGSYVADTSGAAFYADGLTCGTKTDWFLGSLGEMKLAYNNLPGLGGFTYMSAYWSSTEYDATNSWRKLFYDSVPFNEYNVKVNGNYVRPVRSF